MPKRRGGESIAFRHKRRTAGIRPCKVCARRRQLRSVIQRNGLCLLIGPLAQIVVQMEGNSTVVLARLLVGLSLAQRNKTSLPLPRDLTSIDFIGQIAIYDPF